jgi:hypothetical protein
MDRRFRLIAFVGMVLVALLVGVVSYDAGVSHGLAVSASAPPAATALVPPYGWYRPWGFGLFAPFLFVFFWLFVFRAFLWGGLGRRRWCPPGMYDGAADFDEWHRRAHERMKG